MLLGRACKKLQSRYAEFDYQQASTDSYCHELPRSVSEEKSGHLWERVYHSTDAHWPLPVVFGDKELFFETLPAHFPCQGVAKIQNGRLVGRHGLSFGPDGTRLPWHNWHGLSSHPIVLNSQWRDAELRKLNGTALSLMSEFCDTNYCHYLFDSLPRIHLFENSSFVDQEIDFVVLPGKPSKRRIAQLSKLGFNAEKIVWYGLEKGLVADHLLVTTFPGIARCYPEWSVNFLRQRLASTNSKQSTRRLFISREGFDRNVSNMSELLPILIDAGFEIYRPEQNENPVEDFASAEFVIGAHGAGLGDIAFCSPGTFVLELSPDENRHPYYYTIAVSGGCHYLAISGQSVNSGSIKKNFTGRSKANFHIHPEDLSRAIIYVNDCLLSVKDR